MRRTTIWIVMALTVSACSNIGLGDADCAFVGDDVSATNILNVQAVPTARYTPCLRELRLGWDSVNTFAEDGEAGIRIDRSLNTFLTATVTESCDVSNAVAVDSGFPDITRFEDIELQQTEIKISVIPSGDIPLLRSRLLVDELAGLEIDNRPVAFTIYDVLNQSVNSRVNLALSRDEFVWIIDEVDVEESTVQLRSNTKSASGRGLGLGQAIELIEGAAPGVFYRGNWYFTFEGGCITYEFDAKGPLAETVAADADDALGFYPAFKLRQVATDAGFDIG